MRAQTRLVVAAARPDTSVDPASAPLRRYQPSSPVQASSSPSVPRPSAVRSPTTTTSTPCSTGGIADPACRGFAGGCCSVGYECGVQGCLITHSFPKTVLLLTTDTTTINGIPTVVVATSASGTTGRETGTSPKWRATMTATVVEKATTTVYATPAAVAAELGAPAIAGIAGGVVGFLVLLAGAGVLLARHLRGMSRLIEAQLRQQEGAPPEDGGKGAQGAGWTLSDEPHELDPFDKLGELPDRKFLSHELMGSPDGHGVSELDVAPGLEAGDYAAEKEIQVWEK